MTGRRGRPKSKKVEQPREQRPEPQQAQQQPEGERVTKASEVIREAVLGEERAEKEKVAGGVAKVRDEKEGAVERDEGEEGAGEEIPKLEVSIDDESMLEIARKVGTGAGEVAKYVEKTKRFLSLQEEERRRRVAEFIEYIAGLFREYSAVDAGKQVLRLLAEVPEAMIYFAYMWKPKFRGDVLSLLYHMAETVRRLEQ